MDQVSNETASEPKHSAQAATATDQPGHRPTREAILEVKHLQMYFPVKSSGLIRRTVGRWVDKEYRRRPMLVPMVVEV